MSQARSGHARRAGLSLAYGSAWLTTVVLLTGCAGFFPNASMMTPQQLHEAVKIKDTNVACFAGTYAGARVNVLLVNNDKGVPVGMAVDSDCKATFASEPLAPTPKAAPTTAPK